MPAHKLYTASDAQMCYLVYLKHDRHMPAEAVEIIQAKIEKKITRPTALKLARQQEEQDFAGQPEYAPFKVAAEKVRESEEASAEVADEPFSIEAAKQRLGAYIMRALILAEKSGRADLKQAGVFLTKLAELVELEKQASGALGGGPMKMIFGFDPSSWDLPDGFTMDDFLSGEYNADLRAQGYDGLLPVGYSDAQIDGASER